MTALVGVNGSGKSTLLQAIAGQIRPLSGQVHMAADLRRNMAFLPQLSRLDRRLPISTFELVALGAWRRIGAWRAAGDMDHQRVHEALLAVGLQDHAHCQVSSLSGGQLQRALFARIMVAQAKLILLDEPFTSVDREGIHELLELLARWHQAGCTLLVALHDLDHVERYFPQAMILANQNCQLGPSQQMLKRIPDPFSSLAVIQTPATEYLA